MDYHAPLPPPPPPQDKGGGTHPRDIQVVLGYYNSWADSRGWPRYCAIDGPCRCCSCSPSWPADSTAAGSRRETVSTGSRGFNETTIMGWVEMWPCMLSGWSRPRHSPLPNGIFAFVIGRLFSIWWNGVQKSASPKMGYSCEVWDDIEDFTIYLISCLHHEI